MPYDDFDRTATLEKESNSILDLIDERLSENEEIKNSELANKALSEDFDEANFWNTSQEEETSNHIELSQKKAINVLDNPFFGDPDAITKLRNKRAKKLEPETVEDDESEFVSHVARESLETQQDEQIEKEKPKMSDRRRKMWIGTGAICGALLVGFAVCNFISIQNMNNNIAQIQSNVIVKEKALTDLEGEIINQSSAVPEGMVNVSSTTIDASELYNTDIVPSDNIFNRISKFISYLLGK